ncbi:hypothetical protein C6P40_002947 [Pichia californica]|uniref:Carbohydrate kinase PfkB domain-containing protein n=1 Tax=Pichia californica TaxID=460514 RepID=A0A9P6WH37_9ASCO|nr:hypothetical protein C6P42_002732 [[Candida] californica]KAG0687060.1 hypothetical protein C6P40_002947 [[Candida] californica]
MHELIESNEVPYFTSLGMFIIDEINFPTFKVDGILGGGGTFAICGSRMVLESIESRKCAWIVDIGNDCPSDILKEIQSWKTGAVFRFDDTRQCTRGWNGYSKNEFRMFKYLTPKKRITMLDFEKYPWMLQSKSFHFVCSPSRCIDLIKELEEISALNQIKSTNAVIAWEPIPDCCTPEYLQETLGILQKVDILTPNAAECASFFGEPEPTDKLGCETIALKFISYMTKPNSGIVLRCGSLGCLLIESGNRKNSWFPAYHTNDPSKVIDPTGCGNTFVGAFAAAFVKHNKNFKLACIHATIASGACLEQHGLPKLIELKGGITLWNGISFQDRVDLYIKKNKL